MVCGPGKDQAKQAFLSSQPKNIQSGEGFSQNVRFWKFWKFQKFSFFGFREEEYAREWTPYKQPFSPDNDHMSLIGNWILAASYQRAGTILTLSLFRGE